MAIDAKRLGFEESLTLATRETIFNSKEYATTKDANDNVHGVPLKGVEITAVDQDCLVYIHGLNEVNIDGVKTVLAEHVKAGQTIQRYAYEGRSGLINKIEVEPVAAAGKVTWAPLMI